MTASTSWQKTDFFYSKAVLHFLHDVATVQVIKQKDSKRILLLLAAATILRFLLYVPPRPCVQASCYWQLHLVVYRPPIAYH